MNFVCFGELTDLEITGLVVCWTIGLILIVLGVVLLIRSREWKLYFPIEFKGVKLSVPGPAIFVLLGAGAIVVAFWGLYRAFPAENFSFSQKTWTLAEIKEQLENQSTVRIELQGKAASFGIDRKVSGACASDLVSSICELYATELKCDHNSKSHTFTISLRR
ncbi:MAG TPA: hypothetical protein VIW23_03885 [Candidatus Acidoferrum sp.]|jgi:hypothetical protein